MTILRESTSGGLIELGRSTEFYHSSAWSLAGNISLFWKNHAMRAASLQSTISRQLLPSILDFIFLHNIPKIKPKCIKHVMVACSATTVTVGPFRQSWPIQLQQNNNTLTPRKLVVGQSAACKSKLFSGKQNVSPDNVFLFKTLRTTPRRYISLTQAVILSSTSNFFTPIAALCNNLEPQIKKITTVYVFRISHSL